MDSPEPGAPAENENLRKEVRNPNVWHILLFSFVNGACFSIWQSQIFQVMISRIGGNPTVGWLSAASGITQIVGALIVSAAGNTPRQTICRLGALVCLVSVAITIYGVITLEVVLFYYASMLWGIYGGMAFTATEALFADSVETGKRGFVYNLKWINEAVSGCVGSVACLLMLIYLGNDWDMGTMQVLMYVGLALHPICCYMLLAVKDRYALVEKKRPMPTKEPSRIRKKSKETRVSKGGTLRRSTISNGYGDSERESLVANQENDSCCGRLSRNVKRCVRWLFGMGALPYFLCLVSLLVSVGSGVTLPYIGLYFTNDRHVKPVVLMSMSIAVNVFIALSSMLVHYLTERCMDRVTATVIVRTVAAVFLLVMGLTELSLYILIPMYVIRQALMNSTTGITRSILMDCVEKENRAKWSAFESFSSFIWSASAVAGGYIVEVKGYKYTFVITAIIHLAAMVVSIPSIFGVRELDKFCCSNDEGVEEEEGEEEEKEN
ncbi:putative Major Facilitator Superfamily [Trypanosoma vivax]|nr:putative Major Facilitator Superfamily [Trypanosoma vivax]KAH8620786.1 putative Major Facilitator Superfamily [Trypanosoma vivax]